MERQKRTLRTQKGFREFTYLGCPLTKNRSPWCFRLCEPDEHGLGRCGRVAPHSLQGEIARSIAKHKQKTTLATHFERLERMYLAAGFSDVGELGIRVHEGESDIVASPDEQHLRADGYMTDAACFRLLSDAAALAANSIVRDVLVRAEHFNVQYEHVAPEGELAARGRLVSVADGQYLAESVVVDSKQREICRGAGAFVASETPLISDDK